MVDVVPCHSLEHPSHGWTALSIAIVTRGEVPALPLTFKSAVHQPPSPVQPRVPRALADGLSPIKPEVQVEAGTMISDAADFCRGRQAMPLLASGSQTARKSQAPFFATSAAAGVAGHFVGRLQLTLSDRWPETHRSPLVDSAAWLARIHPQLVGCGARARGRDRRRKSGGSSLRQVA